VTTGTSQKYAQDEILLPCGHLRYPMSDSLLIMYAADVYVIFYSEMEIRYDYFADLVHD